MNIDKSTRVHKQNCNHGSWKKKITQTKSIYVNPIYVTLQACACTCVHNKIWDKKKSACTICRDINDKREKENCTLCTA